MRVLITGASGFIGSYVTKFLPSHHSLVSLSRTPSPNRIEANLLDFDVDDFSELLNKQQIEGILHLAAEGNVSNCEHFKDAHSLNVRVTEKLVEAAKKKRIPIIFSSTDQVFSGDAGQLYESTSPNPCHQYGRQKCQAEQVVLGYAFGSVLRLPLVLGLHRQGKGALESMLSQGRATGFLNLFVDEFRRPIHARDAAKALWTAFEWKPGLYHIPGPELMSRMKIAQEAVNALEEKTIKLVPISYKEHNFGYTRPGNLDLASSEQVVTDLRLGSFAQNLTDLLY